MGLIQMGADEPQRLELTAFKLEREIKWLPEAVTGRAG